MPLNIISYKKAIWKGIEGHLKGIVQKLEDSPTIDIFVNSRVVFRLPSTIFSTEKENDIKPTRAAASW